MVIDPSELIDNYCSSSPVHAATYNLETSLITALKSSSCFGCTVSIFFP